MVKIYNIVKLKSRDFYRAGTLPFSLISLPLGLLCPDALKELL